MRRFLFMLILAVFSALSFASVIVTTNGERIENVSIQNETNSAIVYLLDGIEKSIAIEQVFAILYDDGQYKELNQSIVAESSLIKDSIRNIDSLRLPNMSKLRVDPAYFHCERNVIKNAQKEYRIAFQHAISKGQPKQTAQQIAKRAKDSVMLAGRLDCIEMYADPTTIKYD